MHYALTIHWALKLMQSRGWFPQDVLNTSRMCVHLLGESTHMHESIYGTNEASFARAACSIRILPIEGTVTAWKQVAFLLQPSCLLPGYRSG